jgi:hypothetical protein
MPLITIVCSRRFYPPEIPEGPVLSDRQAAVVALANELPGLVFQNAATFRLPKKATEAVTQVNFERFHRLSVNSVDVWIHFWHTENLPKTVRLAQRTILDNHIQKWIKEHGLTLTFALDTFFGPGHGCLGNATKGLVEIEEDW